MGVWIEGLGLDLSLHDGNPVAIPGIDSLDRFACEG